MKKYLVMLAFVAGAMTISSCSDSTDSDILDNTTKLMTLEVGSPSSNTRAVVRGIESQAPLVDWENEDKVFVWGQNQTDLKVFTFSDYVNNYHNYGIFTGPEIIADKYYLMYPAQGLNSSLLSPTFEGETSYIVATIPMYQKATLGSFDPNAAVCTGATKSNNDKTVSVNHTCAFFMIETTKPCYYVKVNSVANNDQGQPWCMAGQVQIEASSSASKIKSFVSGVPTVYLTKNGTLDDEETFPAGKYLIAFAPSTAFPGFEVTVVYDKVDLNNENLNPHFKTMETQQFNVARIYNLGIAN